MGVTGSGTIKKVPNEADRDYRTRAGKAGVVYPIRTLASSATFMGGAARAGGKAGVVYPILTIPSSLIPGPGILTVLFSFTVLSNI